MRKLLTALFAIVLSAASLGAQEYPALGAKLEQYFTALAGDSPEVQKAECDFLIESSADSLVRQYVTLKIYDHYLNSRIMGDDAVAVHVAQKWLLSGKVSMHSEMDLLNAKVYVQFNQSSLIGMDAPQVTLKGPSGINVKIPAKGSYSVIYFYDTGCSQCKVETSALKEFAAESGIRVYAVYVGADRDAWEQWRASFPGAVHAWDPAADSDWQIKYGVLQTPKMFLVNPDGVITGRGLDTQALKILFSRETASGSYSYGEPEMTGRFEQMFASYGDTLSVSHILEVADYLAARTFGEGSIDSFKQVEGDLLYYLSSQKTEVYKDAIIPFVERYIAVPDIWDSENDKVQIVKLGEFLTELISRTPAGKPVPPVTVEGTLRRKPCLLRKGSVHKSFNLGKLRGNPSYVVFYSAGCPACREMLEEVERISAGSYRVKILLIDMDEVMSRDSNLSGVLLDSFDLTSLPFILQLDRKGTVQHRYVDLSKVK